jgi:protein kinase X
MNIHISSTNITLTLSAPVNFTVDVSIQPGPNIVPPTPLVHTIDHTLITAQRTPTPLVSTIAPAPNLEDGEIKEPTCERKEPTYERIQKLGSGAFGNVWLVKENGVIYAEKIVNKKRITELTRQEKNILSQLNHPFIIKLYKTIQKEKTVSFFFEPVLGGDLYTRLNKCGIFSQSVARFYFAQIILALEYIHNQGIVHLDLKLENILIGQDGYIKLIDFGFAKKDPTFITKCGTVDYLAPEMANCYLKNKDTIKSNGKAVDIWTLGIILHEFLTGVAPFCDHMIRLTLCNIIDNPVKNKNQMHGTAFDLIKKLLNKKPNKRLGVNNFDELKSHKWFDGFDWKACEEKRLKAPFIPEIKSDIDCSHFKDSRSDDCDNDCDCD